MCYPFQGFSTAPTFTFYDSKLSHNMAILTHCETIYNKINDVYLCEALVKL